MNPLFVITAVRAAIRIGRTAADAFEQYAQEKPILIPDAEVLKADATDYIRGVAERSPEFDRLLQEDPELSALWKLDRPTAIEGAEHTVLAIAYRFDRRGGGEQAHLGAQAGDEIAGGIMVGQWAEGKGPVRPWARIIVALADVALEYVGSNPGVLGVGGNGEKLIGAIAAAIAERIPDDGDRAAFGPEDRFAERLAGLVLHSGLQTLTEKPGLIFSEAHLQELLKNTLPPVIDALPADSVAEQVEWRNLVDAFLGPAVSAALETVAESPAAFLGKSFASEKVAGVMVTGLLRAASDIEVKERFTKEGLFVLFQAATRVAAENPELILGALLDKDLNDPDTRRAAETVALNVFKSIADVLKDRAPPFGDDLGTAIAAAVIDGLKRSGPALFNDENPWHQVLGKMVAQVLDGFSEALGDDAKGLQDTVFTKDRLVELARVFVGQVAETPHLIIGGDKEVQRIVASVARAIARDEHLLLTADDWIKIAGVAAREAALNPGRLFGLNDKSLEGMLAADVIGRLLKTAGDDLVRDGREVGPVMVGETLREAVIVTLRAVSGNVEQAFSRRAEIETLAVRLNDAAAARALTMGGKEWLRLFRALLPGVLTKGAVPELDDATIASVMAA